MRHGAKLEPYSEEKHGFWLDKAVEYGMKYQDIPDSGRMVVYAQNYLGFIPVSLLHVSEDQDFLQPHAYIFPWASDRNVYEGAEATVDFLKQYKNVLIVALERSRKLWDRLAKNEVVDFEGENEGRYYYVRGVA